MLDLPKNELFSAYIDGELTAEEQAEVEQILNDNTEAAQLVDELRSLSSSLQSLPSYKLDEDLAARVLCQAEQEMLSMPTTPLPKFHQVDVPEVKSTSWARRLLRPRNFAWSAVAIAVAVVLMLNDSGTNNDPSDDVARVPESVTIEPLDVTPTLEAIQHPPIPTVARTPEPDVPKPEVPTPKVPDVVAPAPDPAMVAETTPDVAPDPTPETPSPKEKSDPLLVLQCQLAEGRIGAESLAKLLEQAGVPLEGPISVGAEGPLELTLTTNQLRQVVLQLQADTEDFSGFSFLSTAETAPPRVPSAVGPGDSPPKQAPAAEGSENKQPPKATIHLQGTITLQAKAAPRTLPAETTSVDGGPLKKRVTPKATPFKTPRSLPVKDDRTYRVRFLLKPAEKPAETKPETPARK